MKMAMSASVSGITAHQLQCDNYRCYAYAQFAQEFLAKYHELDQGCEPSQVELSWVGFNVPLDTV